MRISKGWARAVSGWRIVLVALLLLAPTRALHAQVAPEFLDRVVRQDGAEHRYLVYLPPGYSDTEAWPVILFLHGAGERGSDGKVQGSVGLGPALGAHPERWPAIVVLPQVPLGASWVGAAGEAALTALDQTVAEFHGDPSRIYLTGLSMGGNGSWALAYQHPDRFAAVVAICGFLSVGPGFPSFLPEGTADPFTEVAGRLRGIPIQVFHGGADRVVPPDQSRRIVEALRAAGSEAQYTEFPGVGHNAWDQAYASEDLASWLFRQRRR